MLHGWSLQVPLCTCIYVVIVTFLHSFTQVGEFVDVAHFVLSGLDSDLSLEPSESGRGWVRLSDDQVSIGRVELNGICEVITLYA